ncbi:MAG: hypothetical protein H6Q50_323, partial [Deltaproteobacteria bacterium]|nr:hypothetical protein [Deltaproteobacteria bacterium]
RLSKARRQETPGASGKPSPIRFPEDPLTLVRKRKNAELPLHMTAKGLDGRIIPSLIA